MKSSDTTHSSTDVAAEGTAYQRAGVNIEAGYEAVTRMKPHVARTRRLGAMGGLGGFGGTFDLSELNMKAPVLVSGTDGVGTKLMLAMAMKRYDTIGQDVVAMCVNDVIVQGAEPLYFLDYIACGKAFPERIEQVVKGVADGCVLAGCALIGGETAEMPGLYDEQEFDLAGFAVGAVEKDALLTGEEIAAGDVLIGLPSSGVHSNGFSLVRHVLLKKGQEDECLAEHVPALGATLGEALLTPTRIYVKALMPSLAKGLLTGAAHVTGGGFYENLPRMLPKGLSVSVTRGQWPEPAIFDVIRERGQIPEREMFNTFNMGIGMVLAVRKSNQQAVLDQLASQSEAAYVIGEVVAGEGECHIKGIDA
ncbi:phosphoribosylformylglycinamidine cyclo-ligase [Zymobacter sp. IVIA_12111.31 C1]|uniref:phosphoribosylformylglycinamidine cyclo-ligase n=1 Tax=Zymobacter sp. IVIA_12111.31 C1 TaxID=3394854 RepID=UPI0039C32BF7